MVTARRASSARADLAAVLTAAVPSGVTVYRYPPETVAAPALVVDFGSPYRQDGAYGSETVGLYLSALVIRAGDAEASYDALDALVDTARDVVLAMSAWTWGGVESAGVTVLGGVPYLAANCRVSTVALGG